MSLANIILMLTHMDPDSEVKLTAKQLLDILNAILEEIKG